MLPRTVTRAHDPVAAANAVAPGAHMFEPKANRQAADANTLRPRGFNGAVRRANL
jgi:hypothetical protein